MRDTGIEPACANHSACSGSRRHRTCKRMENSTSQYRTDTFSVGNHGVEGHELIVCWFRRWPRHCSVFCENNWICRGPRAAPLPAWRGPGQTGRDSLQHALLVGWVRRPRESEDRRPQLDYCLKPVPEDPRVIPAEDRWSATRASEWSAAIRSSHQQRPHAEETKCGNHERDPRRRWMSSKTLSRPWWRTECLMRPFSSPSRRSCSALRRPCRCGPRRSPADWSTRFELSGQPCTRPPCDDTTRSAPVTSSTPAWHAKWTDSECPAGRLHSGVTGST